MAEIVCPASQTVPVNPSSPPRPEAQCGSTVPPSFPTPGPAVSTDLDPADARDGSGLDAAEPSGAGAGAGQSRERPQRQRRKTYTSSVDQPLTWLMADPIQWIGRRVRSRRSGATYLIRRAFKSGWVELERGGVTQEANVAAVRAEYEPYG